MLPKCLLLSTCVTISVVIVRRCVLTRFRRRCTRYQQRSPCQLESAGNIASYTRHAYNTMQDRFPRGFPPQLLQELQRALQHRQKLVHQKEEALGSLWRQLGDAICNSTQHVQYSSANLQLLLDIDHTLLSSKFLWDTFEAGPGCFADPDLQQFQRLAQHFWQWRADALTCYNKGKDWPNWAPFAKVNGKEFSMWFPEVSTADADSRDHPVPEFIQPVYNASSRDLTHYIIMFGGIDWQAGTNAVGKPKLDIYCYMSVVPAEITILTAMRYELAESVDALRPNRAFPSSGDGDIPIGHTQVDMYLASCGQKAYVHRLCSLLEVILGCQHASQQGPVFTDGVAFDQHDGTVAACRGIKNLVPFNLKKAQDGLLCPRLVIDDNTSMWGVDEQQHKLKLMHVAAWRGRWSYSPRVAIATTPEEDCLESYDTLPEAIEGAADAATAASCCVSSPVLTGSLNPPPDGLDRLLSEALLLIAQAFRDANQVDPSASCPLCSAASQATDITVYTRAASCSSDGAAGSDADPTSSVRDASSAAAGAALIVDDAAAGEAAAVIPGDAAEAEAALCSTEATIQYSPAASTANVAEDHLQHCFRPCQLTAVEAETAAVLKVCTSKADVLEGAALDLGTQETNSRSSHDVDMKQDSTLVQVVPPTAPVSRAAALVEDAVAVIEEFNKSSNWKKRILLSEASDCDSSTEEGVEPPRKSSRFHTDS